MLTVSKLLSKTERNPAPERGEQEETSGGASAGRLLFVEFIVPCELIALRRIFGFLRVVFCGADSDNCPDE